MEAWISCIVSGEGRKRVRKEKKKRGGKKKWGGEQGRTSKVHDGTKRYLEDENPIH
jgi:hypothetical protein